MCVCFSLFLFPYLSLSPPQPPLFVVASVETAPTQNDADCAPESSFLKHSNIHNSLSRLETCSIDDPYRCMDKLNYAQPVMPQTPQKLLKFAYNFLKICSSLTAAGLSISSMSLPLRSFGGNSTLLYCSTSFVK